MRRSLVLLCLFALASSSQASAATWRLLRTDNFTFVGDASESQIRSIAGELERFRAVMSITLPNAASVSPVPTVVVVFSTDRAFQPYQPRFEGRRVEVGGYFQGGEDVNYLAINGDLGGAAVRAVLHEYTHFLVGNTLGVIPVWLNEGLAEFYGTMVESRGGKAAIIGETSRAHLDLLKESTLIPLTQLMAVDRTSPMYNEGSRRSVFYAESWALAHYLTLGNPARTSQFTSYLTLMRESGATDQTFRAAFGTEPSVIEAELREYVRKFSFPAIEVVFSDKVASRITTRADVIPESEAQGYLGDMLARIGEADSARALLGKAVAANPQSARSIAALGMMELRASRVDAAVRLLEQATMLAPDNASFSAALGRALIDRPAGDGNARREALRRARTVLNHAIELDPDTAQTAALLGYTEMALNEDQARAVSLLQRAASLSPARENYRLMLATALMASRDYDGATRQFGQLAARGSRPEVRQDAREGLARVVQLRQAEAASNRPAVAPTSGTAPASVAPPQQTPSQTPAESSQTADNRAPAAAPPVDFATLRALAERPDLRRVGVGETRVLGLFQAVECPAGRVLLVVQSAGQTLRFAAKQLADVAFVTFRADTPGGINCGLFANALRALVTYRPDPTAGNGVNGTAVAVELVPDDFMP